MLIPSPAAVPSTTTVADAAPALVPGGQVGRLTRWIALAVIFFLADAIQLLFLLPDRTGELFAWAIDVQTTSFVLAAAYVAGAYFFIRVVMVDSWHRVAAGFPAVIVFVWGAAGATALHLDRFNHDALSFAAWAGIYAVAPVGLPLLYLARRRAARAAVRRHAAAGPPAAGRRRRRRRARRPRRLRRSRRSTIDVWPWSLTPLTARIVATVMALFGSLWVSVALSRRHDGRAHPARVARPRPRVPADRRRPRVRRHRLDQPARRGPGRRRRGDGAGRRLPWRGAEGVRFQGVPGWFGDPREPRLDPMVWPNCHRTAEQPRARHRRPVRAGPERAHGDARVAPSENGVPHVQQETCRHASWSPAR